MKVIQSSLFRALCAIIIGALLIQYREQTVTWITIAIGVLFFLSGVFSLLSYMSAKRSAEKMKGQYLYDAQGNQIIGMRPNFPLVGLGSLIFGLILALMPNVFIAWLMFILSAILIMGALTQMATLVSAAKMGRVGIVYWLMPTLLLLLGLFTLFKPSSIASRYRMGNAGIWRGGSRQCPEGFQQPTQMAEDTGNTKEIIRKKKIIRKKR